MLVTKGRAWPVGFVCSSSSSALAVAGASCAGDAPEGSAEVTRSDFGTEWPLTVEQGDLRCDRGVITFTADEVTYAVNAAALEATDHPQIDPIWADDPNDDNGLHMSLSPLLVRGSNLCFRR